MFSIEDVRKEYQRLDTLCGIDTSYITLSVSTKGVRRLGFCAYNTINLPNGNRKIVPIRISLSRIIFEDEKLFWDVIHHEYAHALVAIQTGKSHKHDAVFQAACRKVGCSPTRCISTGTSDVYNKNLEDKVKYIVYCTNCGKEYRYYRKSNAVKSILEYGEKSTYFCSSCNERHTLKVRVL